MKELDLIKDKLKQSRIISAEFEHKKKNIQLINIYTPNGNPVDTEKYDYKKDWLNQLIKQLKTLSKKNSNIILAGDFNIIPSAEDVYNVKRASVRSVDVSVSDDRKLKVVRPFTTPVECRPPSASG